MMPNQAGGRLPEIIDRRPLATEFRTVDAEDLATTGVLLIVEQLD